MPMNINRGKAFITRGGRVSSLWPVICFAVSVGWLLSSLTSIGLLAFHHTSAELMIRLIIAIAALTQVSTLIVLLLAWRRESIRLFVQTRLFVQKFNLHK